MKSINDFLIFFFLFILSNSFRRVDGLLFLNSRELENLIQSRSFNIDYFFVTIVKSECPVCNHVIKMINATNKLTKEDIDVFVNFVILNASEDWKIRERWTNPKKDLPQFFLMTSYSNYTKIPYQGDLTSYDILLSIKENFIYPIKEINQPSDLLYRMTITPTNLVFAILYSYKSEIPNILEEAKRNLNFIKFYITYNPKEFQNMLDIDIDSEGIFLVRNPRINPLGESPEVIPFPPKSNLTNFLIKEFAGKVDICSEDILKIYELQNSTVIIFVLGPFYDQREYKLLIEDLNKVADNYTQFKYCIFTNSFDSSFLRRTHVRTAGTFIIYENENSFYTSFCEENYENRKLNETYLEYFLDNYTINNLTRVPLEEEIVPINFDTSVHKIDTTEALKAEVDKNPKYLVILMYDNKVRNSTVTCVNKLSKIIKKWAEVYVINTRIVELGNEHLRYRSHESLMLKSPDPERRLSFYNSRDPAEIKERIIARIKRFEEEDRIKNKSKNTDL